MNGVNKNIELNKPSKVYVKDPSTGEVNEVNIGKPDMKETKKRKKSFKSRPNKQDKPNARFWSNAFWNDNSVSDVLTEIVQPDSIEVSQLAMKDELDPEIWDGEKLNPEVRKVLLSNAKEFIKFAKIEGLSFKDIILTGSLANFNYTDKSDLDVHV